MLAPFIFWGMFSRGGWVPEVLISFFSFFRFFARVCRVAVVCVPCFLVGGGLGSWSFNFVFFFFSFFRSCVRGGGGVRSVFPRWRGLGSHGFRSVFLFCVVCSGGAVLAGHRLSLGPGGRTSAKTMLKRGVLKVKKKSAENGKTKTRKRPRSYPTQRGGKKSPAGKRREKHF